MSRPDGLADERLAVVALVNGKPVRLALDTGAEISLLFRSAATRLRLNTVTEASRVPALNGAVHVDWSPPCRLEWGSIHQISQFGIVDVPTYLPWEVDGVIGWNDIRDHVVQLDAGRGSWTVLGEMPDGLNAWTKWKLTRGSRLLTFESYVGDSTVRIGIDTGANAGVQLSPPRWSQWRSNETALPTIEASYTPSGGFVVRDLFHARSATVGEFTLQDVPVSAATFSAETAFGQSDAILGLFALSRLEVLIDGKGGLLYTRPAVKATRQYAYNRLGAVFVPQDGETNAALIAHVVEGSPAARAGIQNGDELLRIGDLDATLWHTDPRVQPLYRFWSEPASTKLRLVLRHVGHVYEVSVVLEEV